MESNPESCSPDETSTENTQALIQPSTSFSTLCEPQEFATTLGYPTISTNESYVKCKGFNLVVPTGSNIYESYPFALLANGSVTFENGNFHHPDCASQKYVLHERETDVEINKLCFNLQFDDSLKNLTRNMVDKNYFKSRTHDIYLSHIQMKQRLDKFRKENGELRMAYLNMSRKFIRLNKTLGLHERFLILLKEGKVHRLKQLITIALNSNRNIGYIVNKVVDAMKDLYSPHPDQDDKDIAFLILQFGGPALLDICHRAINLPSSSTAYRMLKGKKTIRSSLKVSCTDVLNNMEISSTALKYGHMLKVDETYIDSKVRWCPLDNLMYGFCYEHGRNLNLEFNDYKDVNILAEKVEDEELHIAKEVMVIATSNNSIDEKAQIVLAWPTCSKSEVKIQRKLIHDYSKLFKEKNGAPLLCWATDGDNTRRQIFHSLRIHKLNTSSKIYPIISSLKLIDMCVGENEETVDFDARHLAKRIRNTIIAPQFVIDEVVLSRKDIVGILGLAGNNTHSIDQLVNPEDKQNVSLATDFILTFSTAVRMTMLGSVGFRVASVVPILKLLGTVMEGILALYSYIKLTIEEQLICVSTSAHSLLVLKLAFGTIIPNQLYHDLISTFENAFFCAAKYKVYHPNEPLLLVLLGTDVLERSFGNMRLKNGFNGFDSLEFLYCCRATSGIMEILSSHPEWTKDCDKVMKRLSLDYSKPSSWNLETLKLKEVNIKLCWDKGRIFTEQFIQDSNCENLQAIDFLKLVQENVLRANDNISMLKPNGKVIGVREMNTDWSTAEIHTVIAQEVIPSTSNIIPQNPKDTYVDDLDTEGTTLIDLLEEAGDDGRKHDIQVEVNGVWYHKSTILKQSFVGRRVSKDRLRRVQGLSTHIPGGEKELSLDDVLFPGDPVIYIEKNVPTIGSVSQIMKGGTKVKFLTASHMQNENIFVFIKKIELFDKGAVFEWSGKPSDHSVIKIPGKQCYAIQPDVILCDKTVTFQINKSLMFDIGIGITETAPSSVVPQGSENKSNQRCFLCDESVRLADMWIHVGRHILQGTAEGRNPCGYCGRESCQNKLGTCTKKGNEYYFNKVVSNCPFYIHHHKKVKKASKRYPCTNYLNKCALCKADVWLYNLQHHYEDMHPEAESPKIDEGEIQLMCSKKKK